MLIVSTNKFREKLADYLDNIWKDETPLIISRFGKPMWEIKPYTKKANDFMKYFGFMGKGEDGEAFVNRVRRNKYERDRVKKLRNGNA